MDGIFLSSGTALAFGAIHVLEPGHGKTALLAYVATENRGWKNHCLISLSSALSHSLAVFFIAFAAHYFAHHISFSNSITHINTVMSMISGAAICSIGLWLLLTDTQNKQSSHCACARHRDVQHNPQKHGYFASGMLGIAAGVVPCPTILVAYITGISTGQTVAGIQNVILFSVGMFLSLLCLTTICALSGEKAIQRLKIKNVNINWRVIQGSIFTIIGLFILSYAIYAYLR